MQAASDATPSGMVSVVGLDSDKVAELCAVSLRKMLIYINGVWATLKRCMCMHVL